jgi:diguanylate cyclase (GGDEF)-like protein
MCAAGHNLHRRSTEIAVIQDLYNPYLVALSLVVAVLASYMTLDLTTRIVLISAYGRRRLFWLSGGAFSMGTGIWSMHFIGMLALRTPMEMGYDARVTAGSLLVAVATSGLALFLVTGSRLDRVRLFAGGTVMGLGIAAMHYVGMSAMKMNPSIRYNHAIFALSIAIAIVASWVALWMVFTLRDGGQSHIARKRIGAALVMGAAIAAVHYTGMTAAMIQSGSHCVVIDGMNANELAFVVAATTFSVLVITLVGSVLGTRFDLHSLRMSASLEEANKQLLSLATEDALTGIPNRKAYMESLEQAIARAGQGGRKFTVMFMDLDGFKTVNDSLGHSAGDMLLKAFSRHLIQSVRREDTVARLGGDEFVVLLEGLGRPQEIENVAKNILGRMHDEFRIEGTPLRVTASIGIATYPEDGDTAEALLKSADMAMYDAKQNGRNMYRFFDTAMSRAAARTLEIYRGLSEAIAKQQFTLAFQPKFRGDGGVAGVEALIRWYHPEMGNIPPLEFISVAEQTGQIGEICDWVIFEVCRMINRWRELDLPPVKVAVNLSPEQLHQKDYAERVQAMVEGTGVRPEQIMFEITETVAMHDAEMTAVIIQKFQKAGFDIAIDDFGTGYSSLAYLQQFRVKQLKIDRFFTVGLDGEGEEGLTIVSKMIELAHSLQMVVVAEGVETLTQLAMLKQLKCDEVQGFLLGRPLTSWDLENFLGKESEQIRSERSMLALPSPREDYSSEIGSDMLGAIC